MPDKTETTIVPPDEIGETFSDHQIQMRRWNDILRDAGTFTNEDFFDEANSIAQTAYQDNRRVIVLCWLDDEPVAQNRIVPTAKSEEDLKTAVDLMGWYDTLRVLGVRQNSNYYEELDDAAYDAYRTQTPLRVKIELGDHAKAK